MIGPVFSLEILRGSRRGRLDTLRRLYALCLVGELPFAFLFLVQADVFAPDAGINRFVGGYLDLFLAQHFVLLLLATPAFVAGAVTDEKAQRTLPYLLAADLTSWEIVVGKLLGRLAQVGMLAVVGLPLLAFVGGYAHFDARALLALLAVSAVPMFAVGAASILASVRSEHTRDAVLRVYLWLGAGAGAVAALRWLIDGYLVAAPVNSPVSPRLLWVNEALHALSPLYVLEAAWGGSGTGSLGRRLLASVTLWGVIGVVCLGLSVWRFRPVVLKQLEGSAARRPAYGRPLRTVNEEEPVRWKELEVQGIALLPGFQFVPRWLGLTAAFAVTLGLSWLYQQQGKSDLFVAQGAFVLVLSSLVTGVRASGAVCGEREQATWDTLLLTPLETWEIIGDKLAGIRGSVHRYLIAYAVAVAVPAYRCGPEAWAGALCLLVLTWAAVYFMAATGIACSARSLNSWKSLLATLLSGYGYILCILFVLPFAFTCSACLSLPLAFIGMFVGGGLGFQAAAEIGFFILSTAVITWLLRRSALLRLADAERTVEEDERFGKNFVRVLARALRRHAERLDQQRRPA
jgi:ABC-type transport system involved in multi-copper enzyme maturation permease subunit